MISKYIVNYMTPKVGVFMLIGIKKVEIHYFFKKSSPDLICINDKHGSVSQNPVETHGFKGDPKCFSERGGRF